MEDLIENIGKLPQVEFEAVRWRILEEFYPEFGRRLGDIYVEEVQGHGGVKYAIRMRSCCFGQNEEWEYEPMPSSRTDEWLAEYRWPTLTKARQAAQREAERMLREKR
jgi:hypothetical protein